MSDTAHGNISISASSQSYYINWTSLRQHVHVFSFVFVLPYSIMRTDYHVYGPMIEDENYWISTQPCDWWTWISPTNWWLSPRNWTTPWNVVISNSVQRSPMTWFNPPVNITTLYGVKFAQVTNHRVGKNSMVCVGEKRRSYVHIWLMYNLFSFFLFWVMSVYKYIIISPYQKLFSLYVERRGRGREGERESSVNMRTSLILFYMRTILWGAPRWMTMIRVRG